MDCYHLNRGIDLVILAKKETVQTGLTAKFDRKNRFQIKKSHTVAGTVEYRLSNLATSENLTISHDLFDLFRRQCVFLHERLAEAKLTNQTIDQKIQYKNTDWFRFQYSTHTSNRIIISNLQTTQHLHVDSEALRCFVDHLYHEKLDHPNGVFDKIIEYHRLFQFTFAEVSESISSGLSLRKTRLDSRRGLPAEYWSRPKIS